jgi:hypothetical protein
MSFFALTGAPTEAPRSEGSNTILTFGDVEVTVGHDLKANIDKLAYGERLTTAGKLLHKPGKQLLDAMFLDRSANAHNRVFTYAYGVVEGAPTKMPDNSGVTFTLKVKYFKGTPAWGKVEGAFIVEVTAQSLIGICQTLTAGKNVIVFGLLQPKTEPPRMEAASIDYLPNTEAASPNKKTWGSFNAESPKPNASWGATQEALPDTLGSWPTPKKEDPQPTKATTGHRKLTRVSDTVTLSSSSDSDSSDLDQDDDDVPKKPVLRKRGRATKSSK